MNSLDSIKKIIKNQNEGILISSRNNRRYFLKHDIAEANLLITSSNIYVLVDFRYYEQACNYFPDYNVIQISKLYESINKIISDEKLDLIYIENTDFTLSRFENFKSKFSINFDSSSYLVDEINKLRIIKSDDELDKIKKAQEIAEKSYLEILNILKPGVSEKKISIELERLMKLYGAEDVSFDLITITGKNTSLPHGVPGDTIVKAGDFFTFDIGCIYDGYCSDMTRTVGVNSLSDKQKEIYDIVLNAHFKARDIAKEGILSCEVDRAAREYIGSFGYKDSFGHATGHGVGLDIHENPTVSFNSQTVLAQNMVITIEPGIYLNNEFGVRIEDMYVITKDACNSLSSISKELLIV